MRQHSHRRKHEHFFGWLVICLVLAGAVVYALPVPSLKPVAETLKAQTPEPASISWPNAPEAAVGAIGYGLLAENGTQTPRPIASTAKLIAALTVLKRYPLTASEQGPIITLSANDVALYNQYYAEEGSVVKVDSGEQITERQMLEAMMLPSANNMADSLAIWAFGSLAAYKTAATNYAESLGMSQTVIGSDASGFSPDTQSSAHDLLILGQAVLANSALAAIVDEPQAIIPVAGTVQNVNWLLGQDDIIGIKTGNTDQAGGVYLFAAKDELDTEHSVTIVGAIVGSDNLDDAINSAIPLIDSAKQGFTLSQVATTGQVMGHYNVPWGQPVAAVAAKAVATVDWRGSPSQPSLTLNTIKAPQKAGNPVGLISVKPASNTGKVALQQSIPGPPWWWRLIRYKF